MARKKILVVDDEKSVCDVLFNALCDIYDVEAVHDGFAAIDTIAEHKPDLVILDFHMPNLDGISVAKHTLSDQALPNIKFILLSAYLNGERLDEWIQLFKNPIFFTKPFDLMNLKGAIASMLAE